ncbi:unnamed protein product [Oppiella nova]|uniref:Transposase n=1 Tax=Oppiella nova TaxID=334625 RepID=A0A7R9QLQ7_9ACAR|nr:unnamed protein product [Oppiella nova]CAG2168376.1 unnamed protein product [Oppiella nova]
MPYVMTNGIELKISYPGGKHLLVYRAGIAWRDLPKRFGDFRVIHLRHSRWSKKDADNEYSMIDSTIVRAHQYSAGAKKKSCLITKPLVGAKED